MTPIFATESHPGISFIFSYRTPTTFRPKPYNIDSRSIHVSNIKHQDQRIIHCSIPRIRILTTLYLSLCPLHAQTCLHLHPSIPSPSFHSGLSFISRIVLSHRLFLNGQRPFRNFSTIRLPYIFSPSTCQAARLCIFVVHDNCVTDFC